MDVSYTSTRPPTRKRRVLKKKKKGGKKDKNLHALHQCCMHWSLYHIFLAGPIFFHTPFEANKRPSNKNGTSADSSEACDTLWRVFCWAGQFLFIKNRIRSGASLRSWHISLHFLISSVLTATFCRQGTNRLLPSSSVRQRTHSFRPSHPQFRIKCARLRKPDDGAF